MFALFVAVICALQVNNVYSKYSISVYGDIFKDKEFFVRTMPYIVDNIGGELDITFNMQGSGRHTVPQMCALQQLEDNAFLQAQYLKCEALGGPSELCLCQAGVDPGLFRSCVRDGGFLEAESSRRLQELGLDVTPVVELGPKSTVLSVPDELYLKKICSYWSDYPLKPLGCIKPCGENSSDVTRTDGAVAQFDTACPLNSQSCDPFPCPTTSNTPARITLETEPTRPTPITVPTRPTPITVPTRPTPITVPTRPTPITVPTRPTPITVPTRPTPITVPTRPTPITPPTPITLPY